MKVSCSRPAYDVMLRVKRSTIDSRARGDLEGLKTQGFHAVHACRTGNRQEVKGAKRE